MPRKRLVPLLLLALASTPLRGEQLPLRRYSTADGLPHDRVKRIRLDRRGYVWFCTTEGLARFDGRLFRTYGVADGLPVPSVNDLVETPDGFWVATNGGGVAYFRPSDPKPFRAIPVARGDGSRVNALLLDGRGALWAGTDGGLFRLADAASARAEFELVALGLPGERDAVQVNALLEAGGAVLAGTRLGLVRVAPGRRTERVSLTGLPVDPIRSLSRAPDGSVLAAHASAGLFVLDPATLQVRRRYTNADGLPGDSALGVTVAGGRVLVSTTQGFALLEDGRLRPWSARDGLPEGSFAEMADDGEGGLWLGSATSGAYHLAGWNMGLYGVSDGVGPNVSRVFESPGGAVSCLSSNWRLAAFDGRRFQAVRPLLPAGVDDAHWRVFYGALLDREGDLWLATGRGLFRYGAAAPLAGLARARPKATYTVAHGLASNDVTSLVEDRAGDVWIGCFSTVKDALTRWVRATGRFERFGAAAGLPADGAPRTIAEDAAGDVWVAYDAGDLARRRDGRFRVLSGAHGFPRAPVRGFANDPSGRLWMASVGGGLVRVDRPDAPEPEATVYGPAQGVPDFYLSGLASDAAGRIYFGTSHALKRLDPASGAVADVPEASALMTTEIAGALRARDGALWFATWGGLARLDPRAPGPSRAARVRIAALSVSGQARPLSTLGEPAVSLGALPPDASVSVEFLGVGGAGSPIAYEHRLEGLEKRWSPPDGQRSIQFAHLPPGAYRFRVRAVGPTGTRGAAAEVAFEILTPVWRRWWFLAADVALLVALGYAVRAARARRQRDRDAIRARIARDLHDDLGASVARIGILSEVARGRAADPRSAQEMLATIGDASRTALEKLADGIWAVDPRRDDVQSLADRLRLAAGELLEPCGVAWRIEVAAGAERMVLEPDQRRQIYLLLKEGLTNVAKHAGARRLDVEVRRARGALVFTMRDDGRGFDAGGAGGPRLVGGNGLGNMRRRAEELGARLEIDARPGAGTGLALTVPVRGA